MISKEYKGKNGSVRMTLNFDVLDETAHRAIRNGMDETMAACVTMAKRLVRVDTANLQGSIQMRPAQTNGSKTRGEWGSYNVDYAIYQEIGPVTGVRNWSYTPYLRPSRDAEYPRLVERIRKHYK